MFTSSFLVLLYGKHISESPTLKSFLSLDYDFRNINLVIWNNGPSELNDYDVSQFVQKGFNVSIIETLNNISLSLIYNSFIANYSAKTYVILDDDSSLNSEYVTNVFNLSDNEIGMPVITDEGVCKFPYKNNGKLLAAGEMLLIEDEIFTISSGLVIGSLIVDKIKSKYGDVFDENFYFYGIDTTFCLRIMSLKLTPSIKIISGFEHSLSLSISESTQIKKFRCLESSYATGLSLRYYIPNYIIPIKLLLASLKSFKRFILSEPQTFNVFYIIKALLIGRHYKN